jgi:phage gp29-like protein
VTAHAESRRAVQILKRRLREEPRPEQLMRLGSWSPGIKSSWTAGEIRSALLQHEQGSFQLSAMLVSAMGRDDRFPTLLAGRVRGMLGLPLLVSPPEGREGDPLAEQAAGWWRKSFERVFPIDHQALALAQRIMFGVSLCQVTWESDGDGGLEPRVWNEEPASLYWDESRGRYVYNTRQGPMVIEPGDPRWLLFEQGERGYLTGLVRQLGLLWLIREQAWFDYARWSERHGLPLLKALFPVQVADEEQDAFWEDVRAIGRDTSVLLPQGIGPNGEGYDLQLLEAKDRGYGGFADLLDLTGRTFAIAILGQNLTTEVDAGSFAAASVHESVKREVLQADESSFHLDLREQLILPASRLMWAGADRVAPAIGRDIEPPEDLKVEAEVVNTISLGVERFVSLGVPVDLAVVAERFKVPIDASKPAGQPLFGYHLDYGILTLNEARSRLGEQPVEGGDVRPLPASSLAAGLALAPLVEVPVGPQAPVEQAAPQSLALVAKPFAGYESFEACVLDQTSRGRSEGAARRICGALQAEAEKVAGDYRERVERVAVDDAGEVTEPDVAALLAALGGAESFEQARERVVAAFGRMNPDALAEVMRRALLLAELSGVEEAAGEALEEPASQSALRSDGPLRLDLAPVERRLDELAARVEAIASSAASAAAVVATKAEQRALDRERTARAEFEAERQRIEEQRRSGEQATARIEAAIVERAARTDERLAEVARAAGEAAAAAQLALEAATAGPPPTPTQPAVDEHKRQAELTACLIADVREARLAGLRVDQDFVDEVARRYGLPPPRVAG